MSIVEKALQKARKDAQPAAREDAAAVAPQPLPDRSQQASPPLDLSGATARDLKPVVELDFDRLRNAGRLPPASLARQTDDEIRRIKWPLLQNIAGARNNAILVTSALPEEGKSFISLNLALSIVRDRELRVILVDGDVARPGLTPALGLSDAPGLNDVLDDPGMDVAAVTYRTTVEGLFFVPAGKYHERAP